MSSDSDDAGSGYPIIMGVYGLPDKEDQCGIRDCVFVKGHEKVGTKHSWEA